MTDFHNDLYDFNVSFHKNLFSIKRSHISNFHCERNASHIVISILDVHRALQSIRTGKAAGPDKIRFSKKPFSSRYFLFLGKLVSSVLVFIIG